MDRELAVPSAKEQEFNCRAQDILYGQTALPDGWRPGTQQLNLIKIFDSKPSCSRGRSQCQPVDYCCLGLQSMYMVCNFWPGATLEQFQAELAELEGKSQPDSQLMRSVAEVEGGLMIVSLWKGRSEYESWAESTLMPQIDIPGGMEGRPIQTIGPVVNHYCVLPSS